MLLVKGHEQTGGLGKKEAEKQGCVLGARVLGNCRVKCWISVILCRMCYSLLPRQVEGDRQEMEVPAMAQLIAIKRWWSLQGEVVCS